MAQQINDKINALKRLHYASVSRQEKEERAAKRRAYSQSRRNYHIKNRTFVCGDCLDKTGENLIFSGKQELQRHRLGARHIRSSFRMSPAH